jgi:hypothetical protein
MVWSLQAVVAQPGHDNLTQDQLHTQTASDRKEENSLLTPEQGKGNGQISS